MSDTPHWRLLAAVALFLMGAALISRDAPLSPLPTAPIDVLWETQEHGS